MSHISWRTCVADQSSEPSPRLVTLRRRKPDLTLPSTSVRWWSLAVGGIVTQLVTHPRQGRFDRVGGFTDPRRQTLGPARMSAQSALWARIGHDHGSWAAHPRPERQQLDSSIVEYTLLLVGRCWRRDGYWADCETAPPASARHRRDTWQLMSLPAVAYPVAGSLRHAVPGTIINVSRAADHPACADACGSCFPGPAVRWWFWLAILVVPKDDAAPDPGGSCPYRGDRRALSHRGKAGSGCVDGASRTQPFFSPEEARTWDKVRCIR
jgi:hypothetical protein